MRILPCLAVVLLPACQNQIRSLETEFQTARDLLRAQRYDLALPKAQDGLQRAERNRNLSFVWHFRLLKAEILLGQRNASEALKLLAGYGDPPNGPEWAESRGQALLLRGQASYILNRFPDAENLLTRAAEEAHNAGSADLAAWVDLRRGMLMVGQSRLDQAEDSFRGVLEAAKELHDSYLVASATQNLGYALLTQSRYDEAIPWIERARAQSNELGAKESAARASGNLGFCYFRLGDYENALRHFEEAQSEMARTGNRLGQQIWLGDAGNVPFETGDYAAAAAAYKRALEIARQVPSPVWTARWLRNLAATSIELSDWDAAEKYNNEALALTRRIAGTNYEPNALLNSARIALGRNRFEQAESLFREALKAQGEDPTVRMDAHTGLADLYMRKGSPQLSDAEFRATVAAIDERGANLLKDDYKISYLASLIRFHRKYVDFLMANHEPVRALEVAESSRSRVLAERSGRPEPVERRGAADYQRLARQTNATLLEYWLGANQSYLWVVTPSQILYHVLPPRSAIHSLVEHYRGVIMSQRNPLQVAGDTGGRLYQTLLAPVANDAPKESRFVIVPDDDLYAFNFESLPAADAADKFWVERATVSIAPSLNYLAGNSRASRPHLGTGLLMIGDPAPSGTEYPKLEFAAQEIDSIASIMRRSKETILTGPAARPDSYSNAHPAEFGFIHFSSHATANQISPLDSAVILSGPPEKCRLLARDIMAVPLAARLVTISACRSAGGKTYAGEGLVGFAWAFLKAGAGNVIAGLWDVNDRSTAQLMSGLYTQLDAGLPVADALRMSKLSLIRGGGAYAKPFYWAPFQLYIGVYE